MKILLLIFASLFASPANVRRCEVTCSGVTDNFIQYSHNILRLEDKDSFIVYKKSRHDKKNSVNLEHCNLQSVENISTWLSCHTQCHNIFGIQSIYNYGPKGFLVFPTRETNNALTVGNAKQIGVKLHYQVTGKC